MTQHKGPYRGAKLRKRDGTCTLSAGWGTDHPGVGHCRKHLGSTPNQHRAAAREMVAEQARRQIARMDAPPVTNPFAALSRLAGEAEAWRATCAYLLNKLGEDEIRYSGQVGGLKAEQVRAEVSMYQAAISQSATILTGLAKLDIEQAWVAVEDRKAHMLADAFAAALAVAGLPADRAAIARSEFTRRLRVFDDEGAKEDDGAITGVVIPPRRRDGLTLENGRYHGFLT